MLMPIPIRRPVQIAIFCALAVAIDPAAAFAQSGSAGGSIGNDEKSLSGSRQAPRSVEPEKPARRGKPEAEEPRRSSSRKSGGGGKFDGVWVVTAVGCGSATTSRVVVSGGRFSDGVASGTISPNGVSHSVGIYNGVTVTGTSRTSGNRGTGTFRTSDGCTGILTSTKQ